ncbi:recombinase family protein [Phenylobacterium sp.]|jgi:DNA invertase Pin-like site-specific DNA recombinase|uniref:recombinase family protein n=1 Tax=Phenylobacterium sp. TaxID=1871053 RepID=UPI002F3F33B9
MIRVAIYARYSSDLQQRTSIEDQVRIAKERADHEGWTIAEVYTDYAISGAFLHTRPGMLNLLRDAAAQKFDLVLTESLDRISRDQEDTARVFKRLSFAGVKIISLSEGQISELHVGLKGTMNALYLKDMADKVRRGQRGRVEQGKIGGGNGYGYDVVKRFDDRGEPVRGERTINEGQAQIVRRIFEEFAAGKSPKAIAKQLNKEGVPGTRGRGWSASTIYGNWQRGAGIINQEMYRGVIAWNKVRYVKDPDTGRNVTRINPESEWIRKDAPHLRIVDQALWDKVKARQTRTRVESPNLWDRRRPRHLFSHKLRCGGCGGGFAKISSLAYGCTTARNKGSALCENTRTIRQDELEHTVLDALQAHLMAPELVKEFCEEYTREVNRLRIEHNAALHGYQRQLEKLDRQEQRIVRAIMDGFASPALKAQLDDLVTKREETKRLMGSTVEVPAYVHPSMARRYQEEVCALVRALNDPSTKHEAVDLLRSLVDRIVLAPDPNVRGLLINLYGDLAGILNVARKEKFDDELELNHIRMVVGLDRTATTNRQMASDARHPSARSSRLGIMESFQSQNSLLQEKMVGPERLRQSRTQEKLVGPAGN